MFFYRHSFRNMFRMLRGQETVIELKVHVAFDEEAKVWYVASSDIPGLHLEADDPADLIRRLEDSAPEMIELNKSEIALTHRPQREPIRVRPIFDSAFSLGNVAPAC